MLSFPADRLHAQFFHPEAAGVWKKREMHSIHAGFKSQNNNRKLYGLSGLE